MAGILPFVKDRISLVFYDANDLVVNTIECEATLGAQHNRTAKVTEHPVAKGEATTDNVRPDPDGLVLDCFWSNKPVDPILFGKRYATGNFGAAQQAYEQLNAAFQNGYRALIRMRMWTYGEMVIASMSAAETVDDGHSIKVSITFREVKTATSVTIPQVKAVPTKKGAPRTTGTKPKTTPTNAQKQSILAHGADSTGASSGHTLIKKPR